MKKFNWINLACAAATTTIFVISPTLITAICSGVCIGVFLADASWRIFFDKNKDKK